MGHPVEISQSPILVFIDIVYVNKLWAGKLRANMHGRRTPVVLVRFVQSLRAVNRPFVAHS